MASTNTTTLITILVLLLIVLSLSASSVSARPGRPFHPCNTLLISTYSLSFINPNNNNNNNNHPRFFALVAHLRFLHPKPPLHPHPLFIEGDDVTLSNPSFFLRQQEDRPPLRPIPRRPAPPLRASFLHRGLDVLNVVASLLFGAACGALTAGTMYFLWSLFSSGRDGDVDDDDDDDDAYQSLDGSSDEDDDIFNPKKPVNVYVTVPAVPVAVDAAKVDVPTNESV